MNQINRNTVGIIVFTALLSMFFTKSIAGDSISKFLINNIVLTRIALSLLVVSLVALVAIALFKSRQQKNK